MKPAPHIDAFMDWFAIERAAATLLAELYAAKGLTVLHGYLLDRLDMALSTLRSRAYDLHVAMEPGSVVAVYRTGYRLSPVGIADCEAAIADEATISSGEGVGGSNVAHRASS